MHRDILTRDLHFFISIFVLHIDVVWVIINSTERYVMHPGKTLHVVEWFIIFSSENYRFFRTDFLMNVSQLIMTQDL